MSSRNFIFNDQGNTNRKSTFREREKFGKNNILKFEEVNILKITQVNEEEEEEATMQCSDFTWFRCVLATS